jgi:hypothetical protein
LNIKNLQARLLLLIFKNSEPKDPFSFESFMNIILYLLKVSKIRTADMIRFVSRDFMFQLEDFLGDLTDISLANDLNSYYYNIRSLSFDLVDTTSSTLLIGLGLISVLSWNSGDSYQVSCRKQVEFRKRRSSKTISIRKKGAPGSTITIKLRFACP